MVERSMTEPDPTREQAGFEVNRFIPVPKSVSEHAQQFLAMGTAMTGGLAQQQPERSDVEGWRAMIKATDEMLVAVTDTLPLGTAPKVEKMSVGDVPVFVLTPDGVPDDPNAPIYFDIHGG